MAISPAAGPSQFFQSSGSVAHCLTKCFSWQLSPITIVSDRTPECHEALKKATLPRGPDSVVKAPQMLAEIEGRRMPKFAQG